MLKAITVFCGSASTCPEAYHRMAREVGATIARQGRRLIYGGGSRGLMGLVAQSAMAEGGYVIGVNTQRFAASKYTLDVHEHLLTETMQERKVELIRLGDASVSLPGGIGTLDELTEVFSLAQLGIINKPFGILNYGHYFDGFLSQLERAREDSFLKDEDLRRLVVAEDFITLLEKMDNEFQLGTEAET